MHFSELPLVKLFKARSNPVFHSPRLCASSPQPCRGVPVPGLAEGELIPFSFLFLLSFPFPIPFLSFPHSFPFPIPFLMCEHQRVIGSGSGWGRAVRSVSCEGSGSQGCQGGFVRQLLEQRGSTGAPGRATEQIPGGQLKKEAA